MRHVKAPLIASAEPNLAGASSVGGSARCAGCAGIERNQCAGVKQLLVVELGAGNAAQCPEYSLFLSTHGCCVIMLGARQAMRVTPVVHALHALGRRRLADVALQGTRGLGGQSCGTLSGEAERASTRAACDYI